MNVTNSLNLTPQFLSGTTIIHKTGSGNSTSTRNIRTSTQGSDIQRVSLICIWPHKTQGQPVLLEHQPVTSRDPKQKDRIVLKRTETQKNVIELGLDQDVEVVYDRGDSQLGSRAHQGNAILDVAEELEARLWKARVEATAGHFIPNDALDEILTEGNVRRELRQSFPLISNLELDQLVGKICGSTRGEDIGTRPASERLRRIFATLCLVRRSGSIQKFIEASVFDKDLPFAPEQLERIVTADDAVQVTPSDDHWDSETREEFEAQQWQVLVPFFSQANTLDKIRFYDLDSKDILPFTIEKASRRERVGGFGKVSIVNIHSAHHSFNRNQVRTNTFAIKQLNAQDGRDYAQEVKALNAVQKLPAETQLHITPLLATYQHRGKYYMLFPLAEGDLRHYWSTHDASRQDYDELFSWVVKQALGIAESLKALHQFKQLKQPEAEPSSDYGVHGDIKPENILHFSGNGPDDLGTLKIADFGIARFHRSESRFFKESRHTPTYRAPEYDLGGGLMSTRYDIWSLGCLYLEILIWLLYGYDTLETSFTAARTLDGPRDVLDASYFVIKEDKRTGSKLAELKPSVRRWIKKLRHDSKSNPLLQQMVVLVERMLAVDSEERIDAAECVISLTKVLSSAGADGSTQYRGFQEQRLPQIRVPGSANSLPIAKLLDRPGQKTQEGSSPPIPCKLSTGKRKATLLLKKLAPISLGSSALDRFRLKIEGYIGLRIDWRPLPPVDRRRATSRGYLILKNGEHSVSILLDHDRFQHYEDRGITTLNDSETLPTTNLPQTPTQPRASIRKFSWQNLLGSILRSLRNLRRNGGLGTRASTAAQSPQPINSQKESYFCIDKYWTGFKRTTVYTVPDITSLQDDQDLYLRLRQTLAVTERGWFSRLVSCWCCTQVHLSRFVFLFNNSDLVMASEQKLDTVPPNMCKGYRYDLIPDCDLREHIELIAEKILHGIHEPELGREDRTVLEGIPKLEVPPGLDKKQHKSGWGFHPAQGPSAQKITIRVVCVMMIGVIFIPVWLATVDALDLQTATVPFSSLGTILAIVLAIAALFTAYR
ncbi:hypothetical protein S40293_05940 [Stachybotrys chartarum IBT 40293]|nr:hypothetical protein S40293_05940 [Stachybotrys chartarum IBT 40293]